MRNDLIKKMGQGLGVLTLSMVIGTGLCYSKNVNLSGSLMDKVYGVETFMQTAVNSKYPINDCGTIEVKVGEQFEITAQIPVHYKADGKLSFPENAFELIEETIKEAPKNEQGEPIIGVTYKSYTLEALLEGNYKIEYLHIFDEKISSIDQYTVEVKE